MSAANSEIDQQAADWAAKSEYGQVPETDASAFQRWLDADERHRGAYMKALAVQIHLKKIGKANPGLAPAGLAAPRRSYRVVMMGAIAASLILVICAGLFRFSQESHAFSTPVGRTEVVALSDGSAMTLNTGSKVEVRYALLSRNIYLPEGEALFDVAKNKLRPFWVNAREVHVRAVGTSFSVKNVPGSPVEVLVREGVVAVGTHDATGDHTLNAPANRRVIIADDGTVQIQPVSATEVANSLAWRNGYILLAQRSLSEAVAEFSRYSPIRIAIDDPAVAKRMVSGLFKANDPVGFAKATAEAFHLRFAQNGDVVQLSAPSKPEDK